MQPTEAFEIVDPEGDRLEQLVSAKAGADMSKRIVALNGVYKSYQPLVKALSEPDTCPTTLLSVFAEVCADVFDTEFAISDSQVDSSSQREATIRTGNNETQREAKRSTAK